MHTFGITNSGGLAPSLSLPNIGAAPAFAGAVVAEAMDAFVAAEAAEQEILGLPLSEYQRAPLAYREELYRGGIDALLERAHAAGGVPDTDRVWVGFSPMGIHCSEFLWLANHPQVRSYLDAQAALKIACYGAGLHDDVELVRYRFPASGPWTFDASLRGNLEAFTRSVLGPTGKCSHEPRELLLLFLRDGRDGTIEVCDTLPELGIELKRPTLPLLDLFEGSRRAGTGGKEVASYFRQLGRGREIVRGSQRVPRLGEIRHQSIPLTDEEMAKLRHRPIDIALDPLGNPASTHLSVWLESTYFFDEPLQRIVLSKIVRDMAPGAFLLTNPLREANARTCSAQHLLDYARLFGLEYLGVTTNHRGTRGSTALYRRIADQETPVVRALAGF